MRGLFISTLTARALKTTPLTFHCLSPSQAKGRTLELCLSLRFWIRAGKHGTRFIPILGGPSRVDPTRLNIGGACGEWFSLTCCMCFELNSIVSLFMDLY